MNGIVVGVDGSPESRRALRWAANEARLRGLPLNVVHVWELSPFSPGIAAEPVLEADAIADARRFGEDIVDAAIGDLGDELTGIDVNRAIVEGTPAATLLEAADGADMLVLGSRGRGGFTALLLGSVSQQCVHHASCPIVIIPRD